MTTDDVKARAELQELKTGLSIGVKYLGYVPVAESLKNIAQKDRLTSCCMRMVGQKFNLVSSFQRDEEYSNMLGEVVIKEKDVTLNIALYAFILLDEKDRLLEKHPTDLISFASFANLPSLKGFFCFISHPSEEEGRRCLVFSTSTETIDFIHTLLNKIFNHNGQKRTASRPQSPLFPAPMSRSYVNIPNVPVITLPVAQGLKKQSWFHGCLERAVAESKLHNEGDFLVRMSQNTINNFVLSVISNSAPRHLLLLDEEDLKVREQEQSFSTVVELIEYHLRNNVPIVADGSRLHLIQPIDNDAVRARCVERTERFQEPLIQHL